MAFVTLDGLSGNVEVVVFSDLYAKTSELITSDRPVMVVGRTDKDERECKLIATDIVPLEEAPKLKKKVKVRSAQIFLNSESLDKNALQELKGILEEHPGNSPVFIKIIYPDNRVFTLSTAEELRITTHGESIELIKNFSAVTDVRVV
jgi:DNA polymerase-3 subunit alpha